MVDLLACWNGCKGSHHIAAICKMIRPSMFDLVPMAGKECAVLQ